MKKYLMIIAFVMAFTLLLGAIGVFGGSSDTGVNVKPDTDVETPDNNEMPDEPSEDNLEPLVVHLDGNGYVYVEDSTDQYEGYEFNYYLYSTTRSLVNEILAMGLSATFNFDEPREEYYVICRGYVRGQLVAEGISNTVLFA